MGVLEWDKNFRPAGNLRLFPFRICKDHGEKVMGYIKLAKEEGCTIQCGGERVVLPGDLSGGYYLSPCVLTECHDDMRVIREEIFGAVAAVLPFDTEEEAIRRANDTQFGLGGKYD